ncbi:leucyl aminopeptidase [bacterium]|nr:leucyl aminopeptidase [bacterium]
MKIEVKRGDVASISTPLIIVNLFKGVKSPGGATGAIDKALDGVVSNAIGAGEIEGKLGETVLFHTYGKIKPERVLVVGLGDAEKFGAEEARRAAASAVWSAERYSIKEASTIVHGAGIGGMELEAAAESVVVGSLLAAYRFDKYKPEETKNKPAIERLTLVEQDEEKLAFFKSGALRGEIISNAQNLARDFVNEPSNVMTPCAFAEAVSLNLEGSNASVEIFDEEWIQKKQMNLLWGVAKGSENPPRLIVIKYSGGRKEDPWLGIIGKGVMFDSGGISLKAPQGMEGMKGDMAGAAAVAGALIASVKLGVKKNILAVIPAAMNEPDGRAQNPGDIIKSFDGPSVEIISTDAEGRLIMADALSYARELGASYLIDIATLTGASVVSLGHRVAGLFSTSDMMRDLFLRNVNSTGEKLWPMPMFDEYNELLESNAAEIKNSGGQHAGAITAAKFLERFTDKKPWVHIDMAAKDVVDKTYGCYRKGATGFGVRTLLRFIETWEG